MNRKDFLRSLLHMAAGLAATGTLPGWGENANGSEPDKLPRRKLGRTGLEMPVLGLGGFHVGLAEKEQNARAVIDVALAEGIRFFDSAEMYQAGRSEKWLGLGLKGIRKDVFLMTKTWSPKDRSAESAKRHLEGSLDRLQTEYLDLWQVHGVTDAADTDKCFRKGGAMEYILDAKQRGLVRFVGVSGHTNPEALRRALKFYDEGWKFDAMQFPLNPIDFHQTSFQKELLPEIVRRGIAVLAMKTSAGGALVRQKVCSIDECLRYALSLPVSVAIVGMETADQVRDNARIIRTSTPFTADEVDRLLEKIRPQARLELEWYKKPAAAVTTS